MTRVWIRATVVGTFALALCALVAPRFAEAGIDFTSGKVYMQQKVYDKACYFLERARLEEPDNTQVYLLLSVARDKLRQYASAGGVFQIGLKVAAAKKDSKRADEMSSNQKALMGDQYNLGVKALTRAGQVTPEDSRTTDAGTPQAAIEKERGEPKDFSRFTEGGKTHEFWYYPDQGLSYHFTPGSSEPLQVPYKPFQGPSVPAVAVLDTTVYPPYSGASTIAEAAYNFELAMLIDPSSPDIYKNLSYTFEVLGRPDDAIRAAQLGLKLKPGDKQLDQNLRVAALGRGNRLFGSKKYVEAVPAYRTAMVYDSAGTVTYLSRIAESFQLAAGPMKKGPERTALLDSAAATYLEVVAKAPSDSVGMMVKENSIYNAAVIMVNLDKPKEAVTILDDGMKMFPNSKDIVLLAGQTKFQVDDFNGCVATMRQALEIDPKDPTAHQFLFKALNKLDKIDESIAEYTVYKALSDGRQRTGSQLKTWIDSADNRLGAGHQLKKTITTEGYPDEVRTFSDSDKILESWFYWKKGKSITFLEGQLFSQATFPPAKS